MGIERGELSHRVLRILKHKRSGRTFYTIAPFDTVLTKDGTAYATPAPTSDMWVSNMASLEYDQIEFLEPQGVSREGSAGMAQSINTSPDQSVGRT